MRRRPHLGFTRPRTLADAADCVEAKVSVLLGLEKAWFEKRVSELLQKTRSVLETFSNKTLSNEDTLAGLVRLSSLDELMVALTKLGGEAEKVFRSILTGEEWVELEASSAAILSGEEGQLRMVRLKRQRKLLLSTRDVAIDLTVREDEGAEQTAVVNECMQVMQVVLDRVGMNASVRRTIVVRPVGVDSAVAANLAQQQQRKNSQNVKEKESRAKRSQEDVVDVVEKNESGGKKVGKKKSKTVHVEEDIEETGKAREENRIVREKKKKKKKKDKKEKKEKRTRDSQRSREKNAEYEKIDERETRRRKRDEADEEEKEEAEDDEKDASEDGTEGIKFRLARARLEVGKITKMIEVVGAGKNLKLGEINIPNPMSASAAEGALILSDEERLGNYLDFDFVWFESLVVCFSAMLENG